MPNIPGQNQQGSGSYPVVGGRSTYRVAPKIPWRKIQAWFVVIIVAASLTAVYLWWNYGVTVKPEPSQSPTQTPSSTATLIEVAD